MKPLVEAAWIAGVSGLLGAIVGVGGAVVVAVVGFRSTHSATQTTVAANSDDIKAQIEADRRSRMWERRADAYADAIAAIHHRQDIRYGQWQEVLTGSAQDQPANLMEWRVTEARLAAYASPGVLGALRSAADGTRAFDAALAQWHAEGKQIQALAGTPALPTRPTGQRPAFEVARDALTEVTRRENELIETIRAELDPDRT